jgi:hypothetical protein
LNHKVRKANHDDVQSFLLKHENSCAVAINWLNFGSSGLEFWTDDLTTARFVHCAWPQSEINKFFKSFHRPEHPFKTIGIHRPWTHEPVASFVYADGTVMEDYLQLGEDPATGKDPSGSLNICALNHYSLRSKEEYRRKEVRGNGFKAQNPYGGIKRFQRFDQNDREDFEVARFRSRTQIIIDEIMQDDTCSTAHKESCKLHFPR